MNVSARTNALQSSDVGHEDEAMEPDDFQRALPKCENLHLGTTVSDFPSLLKEQKLVTPASQSPRNVPKDINWPVPGSPDWSSAIGKAAAAGKSGRVIERLMNDCDALRREKKLATVKYEEESRRGESARMSLEALQLSNDNLTSLHESDTALLLKRDRRLQQLKEDIEAERKRREIADQLTQAIGRERDETVRSLNSRSLEDAQKVSKAHAQYEVLAQSWKSLENFYKMELGRLEKQLALVTSSMEEDRRKLTRMNLLLEQSVSAMASSEKAVSEIHQWRESYTAEISANLESIRRHAVNAEVSNTSLHEDTISTLHDLKWALGVVKARGSRDP